MKTYANGNSPKVTKLKDKIRHLEDMVRREQSWHATLLETISNPIFYKNRQGIYLGCNKAFETFLGLPRAKIIGKTVHDLAPKNMADACASKDKLLFEHPGNQRYECKVKNAQGIPKTVIFDKATLFDSQGNVTGLVGVISDISEQKTAQQLIHHLSQMLIQAQERERHMISCELHDTIAQNLSALKLCCSGVFSRRDQDPETKTQLEDAFRIIDHTIQSVRGLASNLRPSSLTLLGLVHSVELLCEEFSEAHDIHVTYQTAGMNGIRLADDVEINLYRIAQEGLNNIRKHARATTALVRLMGARPHIILQIEDNGRGFDLQKRQQETIKEMRMGLRSMQARASLIKGRMTIESQLEQGTKLTVKLEYKDNEKKNSHR